MHNNLYKTLTEGEKVKKQVSLNFTCFEEPLMKVQSGRLFFCDLRPLLYFSCCQSLLSCTLTYNSCSYYLALSHPSISALRHNVRHTCSVSLSSCSCLTLYDSLSAFSSVLLLFHTPPLTPVSPPIVTDSPASSFSIRFFWNDASSVIWMSLLIFRMKHLGWAHGRLSCFPPYGWSWAKWRWMEMWKTAL